MSNFRAKRARDKKEEEEEAGGAEMSAVASDMFAEGKMGVVRRYGGIEGRRGVASFCFLSTH